jgi:hypothetical protein
MVETQNNRNVNKAADDEYYSEDVRSDAGINRFLRKNGHIPA